MALKQFKDQNGLIKKEIAEVKAEILDEFLLNARKLNESLQILEENGGVDEERYICLEGAEIEADICYTIIDPEFFDITKDILGKMTNENAFDGFNEILRTDGWGELIEYEEFFNMMELSDTYENYVIAEQMISF